MVVKQDIIHAINELEIKATDTVIVHSSLKSFGIVDGGPDTVIDAFLEVLTDGTLIFPTLRQKDFFNAYNNWDIKTTPSDVGLISETFRKRAGALRSNQETHSVSAMGVRAQYITEAHNEGKPRIGMWGDYAFSYNSPWQKLYELNGKIVMLGVTLVYNTEKHFPEHKLVNDILDALPSEELWQEARNKLVRFGDDYDPNGAKVWPLHDGLKAQAELEKLGLVKSTMCGPCKIITVDAKPFVDYMYDQLLNHPKEWVSEGMASWIQNYSKKGLLK